jgi:hypothetical protein
MASVAGDPDTGAEGPMRAGGRATEAGMAFQADVGTWIAAHILARLPIGGRFGINNSALPTAVRLETGDGLDDIEVTQSDGGAIHLQCKTSATLATGEKAPLTKTVGQLAQYVADAKAGTGLPDLIRTVAVLAVHARAPATLDRLETGLRAFGLGGAWSVTVGQRNAAEQAALTAFETIARPAWHAHRGSDPTDSDLVDMARIFRVRRFTMDEGGADWREASHILGRRVFGDEAAGDAPLRDLKAIVRDLIANGAPADRPGLLRALRRIGHVDIASPDFASDIARLCTASRNELERLALHARLPIDGGLALARESDGPLDSAIQAGSMLVIGEPGAGKTGALVGAATRLLGAGDAVVFLSVDRFPGVAITADLQSELGLAQPLLDVLAAFPGCSRKILIIDALDAARGGSAEAVFAALIEAVSSRLEDWTVIASIRTFDLRNGRRFRAAMAGAPPDPINADPVLTSVCHFLVPRLSGGDLAQLGAASPELRALFTAAPAALHALLHNIFNLSLAAHLLSDGASPASFGAIRSQSGLIDAYENERLSSTPLQQAAAGTVAEMAARGALAVRKVLVPHGSLDAVIQSGVLTEAGDLVSFTHHVLFDHIAGRFFLEWDNPSRLITQVSGDSARALMLAPALRFAVERLWRGDQPGRPATWALISAIFAAPNIDPVVANVALRTAVENVETRGDVEGLVARIATNADALGLATMLARLSRFVGIEIDAAGSVDADQALAWATLAGAAIAPANRALSDPARFLLHALFDKADLTDPTLAAVFGAAARALLAFAWDSDPPMPSTVTNAIRFTGLSFASASMASRTLLDRILREPHFSAHADQEATWLAEQIIPIARSDPEFAAEIYRILFTQQITDDGTSWFGGAPSRIMPLSSNRRQDYQHCRWHLGGAMRKFLTISVAHATRALIDATLGKRLSEGFAEGGSVDIVLDEQTNFALAKRDYGMEAWDEPNEDHPIQNDDMLAHFVTFLRAADLEAYRESVVAAASGRSSGAVWSRILGVGAECGPDIRALLWPYAAHPELFRHSDTLRDAVRLIATAYPDQDMAARQDFETRALAFDDFEREYDRVHWRRTVGRLLKLVPDPLIATDSMRALRAELEEADGLEDNTPLSSFKVRWGDHNDYYREMLKREGADLDNGPEGAVLAASDALHALVGSTPSESDARALIGLWSNTVALVNQLDEHADQLHDDIIRSGWGHVSIAVERLAESPAYLPAEQGLPALADLIALLDRLSVSPFPEVKETDE